MSESVDGPARSTQVPLFRPEAVAAAGNRITGEVLIQTSMSIRIGAICAGIMLVSACIALATLSIPQKENVTGWLVPRGGLIRLNARDGGVLDALLVSEGQAVTFGQPIARIGLSNSTSSGDAAGQIAGALHLERLAAISFANAKRDQLAAEQKDLVGKRALLSRQLLAAQKTIVLQQRQVALAQTELQRAITVADEGFMSGHDLDARRSALLAAEQSASQMDGLMTQVRQQISEVDARLHAIPNEIAAVNAQRASTEAGLSERATANEVESTYVITSATTGRVLTLPVEQGQSLAQGSTIAIIAPRDFELVAELFAPSRAIGFVQTGDEVNLMYDAFPFERFGVAKGRVQTVSRTILAPSETGFQGASLQQPTFKVQVGLVSQTASAYGRAIPLQPGMLLTAEIVVDHRSLFGLAFDPLFAAARR